MLVLVLYLFLFLFLIFILFSSFLLFLGLSFVLMVFDWAFLWGLFFCTSGCVEHGINEILGFFFCLLLGHGSCVIYPTVHYYIYFFSLSLNNVMQPLFFFFS